MKTGHIGMVFTTLMLAFHPVRSAELLWKADFEKYTEGESIALNSGGANDTFSSLSNRGGSSVAAFDGSSLGLNNGLSIKFESSTVGNKMLRLSNIFTSDHKLMVISFDRANEDGLGLSLSVNALDAKDTRAHGVIDQAPAAVKQSRFTVVINMTGESVKLGNGRTLSDGHVANYYKLPGGKYDGYKAVPLTARPTGFALLQREPAGASFPRFQAFDNFGVWVSTDGTFDPEIMSLDFGATVTAGEK